MAQLNDLQNHLVVTRTPGAADADEMMIADVRGDLSPSQMVDEKLYALLDSQLGQHRPWKMHNSI